MPPGRRGGRQLRFPMTPSATSYHQFGIDSAHHFYDNAGKPVPILTGGEPIRELI